MAASHQEGVSPPDRRIVVEHVHLDAGFVTLREALAHVHEQLIGVESGTNVKRTMASSLPDARGSHSPLTRSHQLNRTSSAVRAFRSSESDCLSLKLLKVPPPSAPFLLGDREPEQAQRSRHMATATWTPSMSQPIGSHGVQLLAKKRR